jgi:hypothetical protein
MYPRKSGSLIGTAVDSVTPSRITAKCQCASKAIMPVELAAKSARPWEASQHCAA